MGYSPWGHKSQTRPPPGSPMIVDAKEASGISSQTHVYMDHVEINLWVVLGVRTVRAMKIGLLFTHIHKLQDAFPSFFLMLN